MTLRLVVSATPDELLANPGSNARRSIVRLCEQFSIFETHYQDIEQILFRLALHETEPGIDNNATGIWKRLFQLRLSGTCLDYQSRLRDLEKKLNAASTKEFALALAALETIFLTHFSRSSSPALIAGKVPPRDWDVTSNDQARECFKHAFDVLERLIACSDSYKSASAVQVVVRHVGWFLRAGFLAELSELLPKPRLTLNDLPRVLGQVQTLLLFLETQDATHPLGPNYVVEIKQWAGSLVSQDFHERLVSIVGLPTFHHRRVVGGSLLMKPFDDLATALLQDQELISKELSWLMSRDALSAFDLGKCMGLSDSDAACFDRIFLATEVNNEGFPLGYLAGLAQGSENHLTKINAMIDKLELVNPKLAFAYSTQIPTGTDAFGRWLRLFDRGAIPAYFVRNLIPLQSEGAVPKQFLRDASVRLTNAYSAGESEAGEVALRLAVTWAESVRAKELGRKDLYQEEWQLVATILGTVTPEDPMAIFYWKGLSAVLQEVAPERLAAIASSCLAAENPDLSDAAKEVLVELAGRNPALVMDSLGRVLMAKENRWRLQVSGFGCLLQAIGEHHVMDWLKQTDVQGARRLARSLPKPYLNETGEPVVPRLSELVLEAYGNDPKVLEGFICGSGSRVYSGNMADQKSEEAKRARRFLSHPLKAVRDWASVESAQSEAIAARWRREDDER